VRGFLTVTMAFTYSKKIQKERGEPDELEQAVAQALFDLETNGTLPLANLYITSAKEVSVAGGKSAVVLFVPYRLAPSFRKIQGRLVHELEKKFSGKHVLIIAQRRILRKPGRNNQIKQQKRPRSRTLTAVHDAILDDVVYPAEIAGKRIRFRLDQSKLIKVYVRYRRSPALLLSPLPPLLAWSLSDWWWLYTVTSTRGTLPTLSTSSRPSLLYIESSRARMQSSRSRPLRTAVSKMATRSAQMN